MKHLRWFYKYFAEIIACVALAVVICTTASDVIIRAVWDVSYGGLQELTMIAFCWVTFIGMTVIYKKKELVSIDSLIILFPSRARKTVAAFIDILLLFANIFLTYQSIVFTIGVYGRPTDILRLPYSIMSLPAIIGFFINTIYSIKFLSKSVVDVFQREAVRK